MRTLHQIFCAVLSALFLFSNTFLFAQTPNGVLGSYSYLNFSSGKKKDTASKILEYMQNYRPSSWTVEKLQEYLQNGWYVSACEYTNILSDRKYVTSLTEEEATVLINAALITKDDKECTAKLMNFFQKNLQKSYDEKAADFALNGLYNLAAASFARKDYRSFSSVKEMAINQVRQDKHKRQLSLWAAELLFYLAQPAQDSSLYTLEGNEREWFEKDLIRLIDSFDFLGSLQSDYYIKNIKSNDVLSISNQGSLISLFIQSNHFLSTKNDDNVIKQMISTGGLNSLGRGGMPSFSSQGEVFYLHHVTPGTDGKGNIVDAYNGYAHSLLNYLIQALFVSYYSVEGRESSAKMQKFIRHYFALNDKGALKHYLYGALIGLRAANDYHDASSLSGWTKEDAALQEELYSILKEQYAGSVACSSVQGVCEVAAEWLILGKIFSWAFKGIGLVFKYTGKGLVRVLPRSVLAKWAAARGARRAAVKWTKEATRKALKDYGWKATAVAAAGASVSSDQPRLHKQYQY